MIGPSQSDDSDISIPQRSVSRHAMLASEEEWENLVETIPDLPRDRLGDPPEEYDLDDSDDEMSDSSEGIDNELFYPENDEGMRDQIYSLQAMVAKRDYDWIHELQMIFPKIIPNIYNIAAYKRWRVYNICSFFEIDSFIEYCELIKHELSFFP